MQYHMALERVLSLLMEYQATGVLQTNLPSVRSVKEALQGIIMLEQGQMISCQLVGEQSQSIYWQGEEARELLRGRVFAWIFTQASEPVRQISLSSFTGPSLEPDPLSLSPASSPTGQQSFSSGSSPTPPSPNWHPRRKLAVRLQEVAPHISALHRRRSLQVYALCDGSYSLEKIAAILHIPLDVVKEVATELVKLGYLQ